MEFVNSVHYYQFTLSGAYTSKPTNANDANDANDDNNANDDNANDNDVNDANDDVNLNVRESWLCNPPTQQDNDNSITMLGLFTTKAIKSTTIICQYNGTCISTKEALQLNDKSYLMRIGQQCYIDARLSLHCLARYINDCRNVSGYNARFVKSIDDRCAWVVATRDIEPNEEIFADYGKWYWAGAGTDIVPIRLSVTDLAILKNII